MPHEMSWATKILNCLPVRWLLQLKAHQYTPFIFLGSCKRLEKSSWWWKTSHWCEAWYKFCLNSGLLLKVVLSPLAPLELQCLYHCHSVSFRKGLGESITNICSYSWLLSLCTSKARLFFSHELPGYMQLWWQVGDENVYVRVARQTHLESCLAWRDVLCTNSEGLFE